MFPASNTGFSWPVSVRVLGIVSPGDGKVSAVKVSAFLTAQDINIAVLDLLHYQFYKFHLPIRHHIYAHDGLSLLFCGSVR
jgi:hypothetical protein